MNRWIRRGFALLLALVSMSFTQDRAELKAEFSQQKAWTDNFGTHLQFDYAVETGMILDLNFFQCTITAFEDDKGASLGNKKEPGVNPQATASVTSSMRIPEKEAMAQQVQLTAKGKPSEGASSVKVAGTLDLWHATISMEGMIETLKLEKNQTFTLGEFACTIASVQEKEESVWGEKKKVTRIDVTFTTAAEIPYSCVNEIVFLDDKGQEISSSRPSAQAAPTGGRYTHTITWRIDKPVKQVGMKYKVWTDPARKTIPFDMTANLEAKK